MGSMVQKFRSLGIALGLMACATPTYQSPIGDAGQTEQERIRLLGDAVDTALERRRRVYDLAWPVLASNTEFCENVGPAIGVTMADRKLYAKMAGGVREADLITLGVEEGVHIVHAHAGSPAGIAGIPSGAMLLAVNETPVESVKQAQKLIRQVLGDEEQVTIQYKEGGQSASVSLSGTDICQLAVKVGASQDLNAHAGTGAIVILTGLIRALDDDALQFVIAHEAAHLIEHHPRKYVRNTAVTGGFIVGPVLYGGATLIDMGLATIGKRPDVATSSKVLGAMVPWSRHFEAEADYLGLYLFARAGGDLDKVDEVFRIFSREAPDSIYVKATHPITPERIVAINLAIEEIWQKQQAGAELRPNKN